MEADRDHGEECRATASPFGVRDQEVADRNSHNLDLKRVYQEVAVLGNLATGDLGWVVR